MWPANETETIELYRLIQERLGWCIVHLQTAFPDAIIESEDGDRLTVEFEHLSKNFKQHGHDPDGCDLVICWVDNWPDAPLPVQALADCAEEEARMMDRLLQAQKGQIEIWRGEAQRMRALIIHVRLRERGDEDIAQWYEAQADKSGAVRDAIRAYMRMQNGESQETAIREAVATATANLPIIVTEAVKEALATLRLSPMQERQAVGDEDPELAVRLDTQLDSWED